jgi:hypothetical protein
MAAYQADKPFRLGQLVSGGNAMASRSPGFKADAADIVERAVNRLNSGGSTVLDGPGEENATALLFYLVQNGVRDEDDLVELAMLAKGMRYNPADGTFT